MKLLIDKQVIEQALEVLTCEYPDIIEAITALRSALESAESVEQEPVVFTDRDIGNACEATNDALGKWKPKITFDSAKYLLDYLYKYHPAPAVPDTNAALIIEHHETTIARMKEALHLAGMVLREVDDPVWEVREAARKALAKIKEVLNK